MGTMKDNENTQDSKVSDFLNAAYKYAHKYIRKPHIATHYDLDDLVSEAFLSLHKGEIAYNEDAGMKFSTYMIQRIIWRMREIDRDCARKAVKGDGMHFSISALNDSKADTWHPEVFQKESSLDYGIDTMTMLNSLSERDRDLIIRHTIEKETFRSISESYNVTKQRIEQWHSSALEILQRLYGKEVTL
jgi:RNA polymerase sigma factor (sigma-70 family)